MSKEPEQTRSRRQFLTTAIRGAAAGAIAALTAVLIFKRGRAIGPLEGQQCVNQGLCRGCAVFDGCRLPAALVRKQATEAL